MLVLLIESVVTRNLGLKTAGTNVSVLDSCFVKSNFYNTNAQNQENVKTQSGFSKRKAVSSNIVSIKALINH